MDRNLAAVIYGQGDLRMEEYPVQDPGPGEVQLRMRCCGLCMTDVHFRDFGSVGHHRVTRPSVLGHEASGVVNRLGQGVARLKEGDAVTVDNVVCCGQCRQCQRGRRNLCEDQHVLGIPPTDGGLMRLLTLPARNVYRLPENADFEEGALMEPLSVAVNAVNRAGVGLGDLVVVLGAGPIGLLALQAARAKGASRICITDVSEERLQLALRLGASHGLKFDASDSDSRASALKIQETLGEAPDVALECSGTAVCLQTAILAVRMGGVVAAVGIGHEQAEIPITEAVVREVDIRGCVANNSCFSACVSMLATSQVEIKPLISHRFPLEEVPRALEVVTKRQGLKVMITCGKDFLAK